MPKYAALLRAINVGGHTVKMEHLRALFEAMGFTNVETFIASGNVIFDAKRGNPESLERKIEKHLQESLGYEVKTFVRTISELAAVAAYLPFGARELNKEDYALYIGFVADWPDDQVKQKILSFCGEIDDLHVSGREIYWLCRAKMISDSKFSGAMLEKILGAPATIRNSTTIRKIAAKYSSPGRAVLCQSKISLAELPNQRSALEHRGADARPKANKRDALSIVHRPR